MANRVVGCFNSSEDLLEMMRDALQAEGYQVVIAHVHDIERGRVDLRALLRDHDPRVIVWDLSPPYDQSWRFLDNIRHVDEMEGRCIVVTTTNKKAVEEIVHVSGVLEIVGRPFDLDELLRRVEAGWERCAGPAATTVSDETSTLPNG